MSLSLIKNKWFKRGISILGALYSCILAWLAYMTVFSAVEYKNTVLFIVFHILVNLIFGAVMFVSRKQVLTVLCSMLNLLLVFPMLLFGWGDWIMIVPPVLVAVFMFFACRMGENVKTVFGTVFLLMYILGGIAFFLLTTLFFPKVNYVKTIEGESPSGLYRYYVLDISDNAGGRTEVYVEPNNMDSTISMLGNEMIIFKARGYAVPLKKVRNHNKPEITWDGNDIYIDGEIYAFTIDDRKIDEQLWTYR